MYATGDPAAQWAAESFQSYATLAGGQSAALEQYAAGQTAPDDWNAGPLHAGTNMNLIGAANLFTAIPSASRSGNTLSLDVTPFSDNQPGHLGSGFQSGIFGATGKVTGSYEIDQNGKKIAGGNAVKAAQGSPDLYAQARLSAKPIGDQVRGERLQDGAGLRAGHVQPHSMDVAVGQAGRGGAAVRVDLPGQPGLRGPADDDARVLGPRAEAE